MRRFFPTCLAALAAAPAPAREDPPALSAACVRGAFLREFRRHRLDDAAKALADVASLPESDRAAFDLDRTLLESARAAIEGLPAMVAAAKKLPAPLGRAQKLRGDVAAPDAEGFTLKDAKGETRVRWDALDWRDLADFLAAREPKSAANARAAGAMRVLDGDVDRGWKALTQVREGDGPAFAKRVEAARADFEAAHREAKAIEAFDSIPADASGEVLVAAARTAFADGGHAATETYRAGREALAARVVPALGEVVGKLEAQDFLRAKVDPLDGGRVRLHYAFEKPEEIEDWVRRPYPEIEGPWKELPQKVANPGQEKDWAIVDGQLLGAGRASLFHAARFAGDTSLRFLFKAGPIDKAGKGDQVDYIFLAGILDDGKGSFVAAQSGRALFRLERGSLKTVGAPAANAPNPEFGKPYEFVLEWVEKKSRAKIAGTLCQEEEFADGKGGGAFLWLKGPVSVRIDEVAIEGALDPEWVPAARAARVAALADAALPPPR